MQIAHHPVESSAGSRGYPRAEIYQCHVPVELKKPADRVTLVAAKGTRATILSTPLLNKMPVPQVPEKSSPRACLRHSAGSTRFPGDCITCRH
jgi:hypothetical protein